jgi:protein TonB
MTSDLDRQPQLRTTTKPAYPPAALAARAGGIVLLRVLVSATGTASRVEIVRGVQPDLDQAAVAAVRQWRFDPGQKGGAPVEAWMTVAVPFDPSR